MRPSAFCILAACVLLAGCKIVAKSDETDAPQDDATRMAALVAEDWDTRILPRLRETASPAPELLAALAADFSAGSVEYNRASAVEGAPSVFVIRGEGSVTGANTESRAARLNVDMDGDGAADLDIQLGPVIRGTALRDALPFYEFTAFRDQIEFAKLSRALNDAAHAALPATPDDSVGKRAAFVGAFTMAEPADPKEVVPVELSWPAP